MIQQYIHIDADKFHAELRRNNLARFGGVAGCIPKPLGAPGLRIVNAFNDTPDKLVLPADYKEVVVRSREEMVFPEFHQLRGWTKLLKGRWNQNGLNYCWAWSLAAAFMDTWCREGKPPVLLAPNGLGGAVGFKNSGDYLEHALQYFIDHGCPSVKSIPESKFHSRNTRDFASDWKEEALLHRLNPDDVMRMDNSRPSAMIQHCITSLRQGDPVYIAYYWWSHALELIGLEWDESVANNLAWIIRNSHDEEKPLRLTGDRAVPSEGFSAPSTMAA